MHHYYSLDFIGTCVNVSLSSIVILIWLFSLPFFLLIWPSICQSFYLLEKPTICFIDSFVPFPVLRHRILILKGSVESKSGSVDSQKKIIALRQLLKYHWMLSTEKCHLKAMLNSLSYNLMSGIEMFLLPFFPV